MAMSTAQPLSRVSAEDYLAFERVSRGKHEYMDGVVYAMAGGRTVDNRIATNLLVALGSRLSGHPCEAFNSDMKIRVRIQSRLRFYYPDASVVCRSNPPDDPFQDQPVAVFEVLSRDTRRIDEGEKMDAYLTIPSLNHYVLLEQDSPAAAVYRRQDRGFVREVVQGLDAVLRLGEIGIDLPLKEIYRRVEFLAEAERSESDGGDDEGRAGEN